MFLFFAGVLGGALNSVAGGGSFIALPALLFAGINPVTANATSTLALWPGGVSSAIAYRREIELRGLRLIALAAVSFVGGLLGAMLLVRTSDTSFMRLLPWLMLAAAVTFTFGRRAETVRVETQRGETQTREAQTNIAGETSLWRRLPAALSRRDVALLVLAQFAISIYGGYFGGGMGIMMLATLSIGGMRDIHGMNGLKAILGAVINGVALIEFIASGSVVWSPGLVMAAGGIVGGYAGASIARRVARAHIRRFVMAIAWVMTTYFFLR